MEGTQNSLAESAVARGPANAEETASIGDKRLLHLDESVSMGDLVRTERIRRFKTKVTSFGGPLPTLVRSRLDERPKSARSAKTLTII